MTRHHETKYFGIDKVETEHGWYLYESRYGTDEWTGSEPTAAQIERFRNQQIS